MEKLNGGIKLDEAMCGTAKMKSRAGDGSIFD
jgi:hypothetical protein